MSISARAKVIICTIIVMLAGVFLPATPAHAAVRYVNDSTTTKMIDRIELGDAGIYSMAQSAPPDSLNQTGVNVPAVH